MLAEWHLLSKIVEPHQALFPKGPKHVMQGGANVLKFTKQFSVKVGTGAGLVGMFFRIFSINDSNYFSETNNRPL